MPEGIFMRHFSYHSIPHSLLFVLLVSGIGCQFEAKTIDSQLGCDPAIEEWLAKKVSVDLYDVTFDEALEAIGDSNGIPLGITPAAKEHLGLQQTKLLNLQMKDVPVYRAIYFTFANANGIGSASRWCSDKRLCLVDYGSMILIELLSEEAS